MTDQLVVAVVIVVALIALYLAGRSSKTAVGGVLKRDRSGRLILVLTPLKRKKRRR
jgi:hypothetical protein